MSNTRRITKTVMATLLWCSWSYGLPQPSSLRLANFDALSAQQPGVPTYQLIVTYRREAPVQQGQTYEPAAVILKVRSDSDSNQRPQSPRTDLIRVKTNQEAQRWVGTLPARGILEVQLVHLPEAGGFHGSEMRLDVRNQREPIEVVFKQQADGKFVLDVICASDGNRKREFCRLR